MGNRNSVNLLLIKSSFNKYIFYVEIYIHNIDLNFAVLA